MMSRYILFFVATHQPHREYKLDELARAAGVSTRTVRYYVQRGLLPAPVFRAKDTAYDETHLARLRAIRKLQDLFFPLEAIAVELAGKSLAEIERIAELGTRSRPHAPPVQSPPAHPPRVHSPPVHRGEALVRHTIAPGVELLVSGDASDESRALAERILNMIHHTGGRQ